MHIKRWGVVAVLVVGLVVGFVVALRTATRVAQGAGLRVAIGIAVLLGTIYVGVYPSSSQDLFHNIASARILGEYGENPLVTPPSAHPEDPLVRQVRAATDHAANAAGRLSGKELLKFANDETTIAGLKDRIAKTIDYLKGVKASEVDGTEGKDIKITFPNGNVREFTGQSLLLGNSLPNFYFHATTAYDILRSKGVPIGKRDFLGKMKLKS